jgi:large subunit ribosomal protein L18
MTGKTLKNKSAKRLQRKRRIRSKISGCASLPRVSIFRSNRYISAQAINDESGSNVSSSTLKNFGS